MVEETIINIEVGKPIKNYPTMCKMFGFEPTKGKGRKYHFKELSRYCTYHIEGQKIIPDTVYDKPLDKVDGRTEGKNNIYGTTLDTMLLNSLMNDSENNGNIEVSRSKLLKEYLPIFAKSYFELVYNDKDILEKYKLNKIVYNGYLSQAYSIVKQLIKTTGNRLDKNGLIIFQENLLLKDLMVSEDEHTDYANDELKKLMKEKGKLIYEEMEISPCMRAIPEKNKIFVKKMCDVLNAEPNINRCLYNFWNVYDIELLEDIEIIEPAIKELQKTIAFEIRKKIQAREQTDDKDSSKTFFPYKAKKYIKQFETMDNLVFGIENTNDKKVIVIDDVLSDLPF